MSNISRSYKVSFHSRRSLTLFTMSPRETTALLPSLENDHIMRDRTTLTQKLFAFIKGAEGEPSWRQSYRWLLLGSYFNILLVFVPLSAFAHHLHWDVSLRFGFSFLAIVPLAKVLFLTNRQGNYANIIYLSFWAILLNKCRQSLGKPWLVYSMHLLEMRLKSLLALLPCCRVRSRRFFTWPHIDLVLCRSTTYCADLREHSPSIDASEKKPTCQCTIDAGFHPIQYPPCLGLFFFSWLASFLFQRCSANIPSAGFKRKESHFRVTAAQA